MLNPKTAAKRTIFGIEPRQVRVDTRGFRVTDGGTRSRIESIGRAFVHGYETALVAEGTDDLACGLDLVQPELRGFAFEGAAMAVTLLDHLRVGRRRRWPDFMAGIGDAHLYMLHVGAGWAFARLPGGTSRLQAFLRRSDPLLGWLAVDGYGFHHGFFGSTRALGGWRPTLADPYGARAFDQGLGRSLWFVEGAHVERVAQRVATFASDRHGDLWSGVGLACAYAGIISTEDLHRLGLLAAEALPQLRQGVAFAATARIRAGYSPEHTERACEVLWGASAAELAALTGDAHDSLGPAPTPADYEEWRGRVAGATQGARAS